MDNAKHEKKTPAPMPLPPGGIGNISPEIMNKALAQQAARAKQVEAEARLTLRVNVAAQVLIDQFKLDSHYVEGEKNPEVERYSDAEAIDISLSWADALIARAKETNEPAQ